MNWVRFVISETQPIGALVSADNMDGCLDVDLRSLFVGGVVECDIEGHEVYLADVP